MSRHVRLVMKNDPGTSYLIEEREQVIGRSKQCDISIDDGYISRHQAKVYYDNGQYVIENIGSNPIFVNGNEVPKHLLSGGDEIALGKTELVFRLEEPEQETSDREAEEIAMDDKTVFMASPLPVERGPRLVVATPDGKDTVYPIEGKRVIVGRSADSDIRLEDLSVSRRHCVIEKEREGYVARSLTYTNPVFINDHPVNEKLLVTGDQLKLGPYVATFLSDRAQDAARADERVVLKGKGVPGAVWVIVATLLVAVAGYFAYSQFYAPRKVPGDLKAIAQKLESGDSSTAYEMLAGLLSRNLPGEEHRKAMELMLQASLLQAEKLAQTGRVREAKGFLAAYVAKYGVGDGSKTVRDRLDSYRLLVGQELAASGDHLGALREFSAVTDDSAHYDQAQQALSRIWLSSQQKQIPPQPLPALLAQAEEHFQAKRYTTPLNNNAYAIYQTILTLDPDNRVAQERISQMKAFYLDHGEKFYQVRNFTAALSYFERYMLIDPDNPGVKEKAAACRKSLGKDAPPRPF